MADSSPNAAPDQASKQSIVKAAEQAATATYQAPYQHYEQSVPNMYIVAFNAGHTIAKHYAFVGREFELTTLNSGYFATIDNQLFDTIRRDPGVRYVEDDAWGEREG